MKGILLAGGSGTRMYPVSSVVSKHLLPIYDKPMIYYPLTTLMLAGIRDIMVITTPEARPNFETLLGNGSQWGIRLSYASQKEPRGIAEALIISESFLQNSNCCLILGDNIFYRQNLTSVLVRHAENTQGAKVFAYYVKDPSQYAVMQFDIKGNVTNLEEKPKRPKSNYAVPGIYFYDQHAVSYAKELQPSKRHELEITDLNRVYLAKGQLSAEILGRGTAWLDAGTPDMFVEASRFIETVERRQGLKIACPEEIALFKGFVSTQHLRDVIETWPKCSYRRYVAALLD